MSSLRSGFTTGTCAAAAAKAAALLLLGRLGKPEVEIELPEGGRVCFPVVLREKNGEEARVGIRKDAGDDPDVTNGVMVIAAASFHDGSEIIFKAGEGVGIVTKAGLSVAPGEPAINPGPRKMIRRSIREVSDQGFIISISIPGGRDLAAKTFNPRLGVVGGLSILGTTGRVRPFSCPALRESLRCALRVAWAGGVRKPVLVPGHIGERAARRYFSLTPDQVIEVSNEWGFMLDSLTEHQWEKVMILGHPGKLAKLAAGDWDTHSARSRSALPYLGQLSRRVLKKELSEFPTVEGLFASLGEEEQRTLGHCLAAEVRRAVHNRLQGAIPVAVFLVNLQGRCLGQAGDLHPWKGADQ
jgi:cobalt-precorrin-5B (C1)-methyltransferase